MSSISCWTSATRCSNSSVSHPTSNSYPSTFSWSIHRRRCSSPLSILSALHLRASPSIRDLADRRVVGLLDLRGCRVCGTSIGPEEGTPRSTSPRAQGTSQEQAAQFATRLRSFHFPKFVYPYTLLGLFRFRLFILPLHHPPDMRRDVQEIFRATPHHKQVMMFSATLAKDIRVTCKKFMANVCSSSGRRIFTSNIFHSRSRFLSMMRQS